MRKMFSYRLLPTKKQIHALTQTLDECRWLYNHLLAARKEAYEQTGKGPSLYEQQETFGLLKVERPALKGVHSQVLQNVAARIDLAFNAFFRRVRDHAEEPGYPRFRGRDRYDSFTFPQSGFSITHDERVCLSKIGSIKMVYHRSVRGRVKTCTIHRASTGKWYVSFAVESRKIVTAFGVICMEDLQVNRLLHNHCLSKSIADAAWSLFFAHLSYKAEEAGRQCVPVNPAYTSQDCSRCHHRQKMPLSERTYHCPCCLLSIDRDLNAALNIKAVGLHSVGLPLKAPAFWHGE